MTSYLVFFTGSLSNTKMTSFGLSQESCMGPLLFSLFINDFPLSVKKANVVMYTEDAILYYSSTTISELRGTLQEELDKMNKLVLNTTKTKCTVFNNVCSARNQWNQSSSSTRGSTSGTGL